MSGSAGAGIPARRLLDWADLDEARRRRARARWFALPAWAVAGLAGTLLGAEVLRRGAENIASASTLWTLALTAAATLAAMGAPFRLYWRHDAALLARLPIPGGSLYRAAAWRSARAGARVMALAVPGVAALTVAGDLASASRHLALAIAGAAAASLLAPAAALAAGAMVASERAQAAVASLAGEVRAPPTAWLGMLPGIAAAAIALVLLASGDWAQGGGPRSLWLVFGLVAAAGAAHAWALRAAPRAMVAALREISALDRDRLAHVDKVGPSRLERLWARALVPAGSARALYDKDAVMLRRRYPMVYVGSAAGVGALWIVAATRPDEYLAWAAGILASLGAYAAVVARRLWSPPIEHERFLRSLPVKPRGARAAKRAGATLRVIVPAVLGGGPVIARAADPAMAAIAVAAVTAASLALVIAAGRPTA